MRKLKRIIIALIAVFTLALTITIPVCAATPVEGNEAVEPTPQENIKEYIFQDEEGTAIFKLKEDGTGIFDATFLDGKKATLDVTWIMNDKNQLEITMLDELFTFEIGVDNTLSYVQPEPIVPDTPIEDEEGFQIPENVVKIFDFLKNFSVEELKTIGGILAGWIVANAFGILAALGALVYKIIKANRHEEQLDAERMKELEERDAWWEARFNDMRAIQAEGFAKMQEQINKLDVEKRKIAIEEGQKMQNDLDEVIKGINLE